MSSSYAIDIEKWNTLINGMFEYYNKKENYNDEKWKQSCEYMYAFKCYTKNEKTDLLELLIEDISHNSLFRVYVNTTNKTKEEESFTAKNNINNIDNTNHTNHTDNTK
jgi:hypothetical protein